MLPEGSKLKDIHTIKEFDEALQQVLTIEGIYILPGSVLRVPSYAWSNWGIELTYDNHLSLYEMSQEAYSSEWKDTDASLLEVVSKAATSLGIGDINKKMNEMVAKVAVDYLYDIWDDSKYTVVDVGAGTGGVSIKMVEEFLSRANGEKKLRKIKFVLVEPSKKRLEIAQFHLFELGVSANNLELQDCRDIEMDLPDSSVDVVVSTAAIHHNAFNYHLHKIFQVMKPGSVFVNGDWHVDLWHDPVYLFHTLHLKLFDDQDVFYEFLKEIDKVYSNFGITVDFTTASVFTKPIAIEKANQGIVEFWLAVNDLFKEESVRQDSKLFAPILYFEAHESIENRLKNLKMTGFEVDPVMVRMAFKNYLRTFNNVKAGNVWKLGNKEKNGDLNAVMFVYKPKTKI